MKKQFCLKRIPYDLWKWVEDQAYARAIAINELIIAVLECARQSWTCPDPLAGWPVRRRVTREPEPARASACKDQYCLRSIPDPVWRWLVAESRTSGRTRRDVILGCLQRVRGGVRQPSLFDRSPLVGRPPPAVLPFTFVDLFAGIGGFRVALQGRLGGECVFSSEWDKFCVRTYERWFGDRPCTVDIRQVRLQDIPSHDILAAGFPCQPFSIAGVSKKKSLGQKHGFDCDRQGNLFFRIRDIVEARRPKALILENVKNLCSHDHGRTWQVIRFSLEDLGYAVHAKVIDAAAWVPQHRERIFIVCFRRDLFGDATDFDFPAPPARRRLPFRAILEDNPDPKYILTDHLWSYLQAYAARHRRKGNGFGYGITDLDGISRTLSARYYKDGSEILVPRRPSDPKVPDKADTNPRRLTPVEAAHLMGFWFVRRREDIPVSDTQAYKQFGNAVVPDVVEAVAKPVLEYMRRAEERRQRKRTSRKIAHDLTAELRRKVCG